MNRILTDMKTGQRTIMVALTEEQAFSLAELVNNSAFLRDNKTEAKDAWYKLMRAGDTLRRMEVAS